MKNPEMFMTCMKLCQIIIFEIFLNMWEMLSEFLRKDLDWYLLFFFELLFHSNEFDSFVKE